jgi:hypothetical protein
MSRYEALPKTVTGMRGDKISHSNSSATVLSSSRSSIPPSHLKSKYKLMYEHQVGCDSICM